MIAGYAPVVLGIAEINCPEFMYVQYMPLRIPGQRMAIPANVQCFTPLLLACEWGMDDIVYLTAKHTFVAGGEYQNRPGWHTDGFGSDDVNYLWSDCVPTHFCVQPFELSDDHELSLKEMQEQARAESIVTYPANTLLRLDQRVVHRPGKSFGGEYRTFAKITISKNRYNLRGNARNPLLKYDWPMFDRAAGRNDPVKKWPPA